MILAPIELKTLNFKLIIKFRHIGIGVRNHGIGNFSFPHPSQHPVERAGAIDTGDHQPLFLIGQDQEIGVAPLQDAILILR